jgi:hypothetical protein
MQPACHLVDVLGSLILELIGDTSQRLAGITQRVGAHRQFHAQPPI